MDDLKERLRAVPVVAFEYKGQVGIEEPTLAHEAADHIEALEAKLAVAREALEKVCAVRVCRESDNIWAGSDRCKKIARQALKELDND